MPPNELKKLTAALDREKQNARRVPSKPDEQTKEEERDLKNQKTKTVVRSYSQNIKERKKYAKLFFILACSWLLLIIGIVVLDGFHFQGFNLSDRVTLTLIGSTTVNLLGILYAVANYLFPKR